MGLFRPCFKRFFTDGRLFLPNISPGHMNGQIIYIQETHQMNHYRDIHDFRNHSVRPLGAEALNEIRAKIPYHAQQLFSGSFPVTVRNANAQIRIDRVIFDPAASHLLTMLSVCHIGNCKLYSIPKEGSQDTLHSSGQTGVFCIILKRTALRNPQYLQGSFSLL